MPEYAWIIPGYVWLCLNVSKFVWMAFVLHSPILISKGTIDCFLEKKKVNFFYSNWKYLILFFIFRLSICTSKVLNLLLPLWAKGAGSFESYTTSEIANKYIYDAFFNDLFIYFVVVVFFNFLVLQRS